MNTEILNIFTIRGCSNNTSVFPLFQGILLSFWLSSSTTPDVFFEQHLKPEQTFSSSFSDLLLSLKLVHFLPFFYLYE